MEHFDESLVALQLLLDLDVGDILYLKTKVSGALYSWEVNECMPLKKQLSEAVMEFLHSDKCQWKTEGDMLLYMAAHWCLDETIASLGHERFKAALMTYKRLLRHANVIFNRMGPAAGL